MAGGIKQGRTSPEKDDQEGGVGGWSLTSPLVWVICFPPQTRPFGSTLDSGSTHGWQVQPGNEGPTLPPGSLLALSCRNCAAPSLCTHRPHVVRLHSYGEVAEQADPTALPHPEIKTFVGEIETLCLGDPQAPWWQGFC